MHEITVPKLNSNDTGYVLTTWHFADGDPVPAGAEVAVVETSKAAEELATETGGILQRRIQESQECRPGEVIGHLFDDDQARRRFLAEASPGAPRGAVPADLVVTEPAQRLIAEHGIDLADLRTLGKKVIGTRDVLRLVRQDGDRVRQDGDRVRLDGDRVRLDGDRVRQDGDRVHRLSPQQAAVAEVVAASHKSIPAAYAMVSVTVDGALALPRPSAVRLPELVICCVAGLIERFPLFFASARDDGTAMLAGEARVGVTIDVGHGLTIPVLGRADLATPASIARAMTAYRGKALRQQLTATDLARPTIAVSLPAGEVLVSVPIVPPGLSCMLALGATHTVPDLDANGTLIRRQVAHLGLSYDHRLINGRDAALFLGELKTTLEAPERLRALLGGTP